MNKARLLRLANEILPNVLEEEFDLVNWRCGSVACAVGWACRDPVFNEEGLRLTDRAWMDVPMYKDLNRWPAVAEFFDVGIDDALDLFAASSYPRKVVKQSVIDRINKFVKEN